MKQQPNALLRNGGARGLVPPHGHLLSLLPHSPLDDSGNHDDANDDSKIRSTSHLSPYLACKIWQITNHLSLLTSYGPDAG